MSLSGLIKNYPALRFFLTCRFLFIFSMQMVNVAVGWYLYELTGEALALGYVGLAEVIPALSLALYAGHIIDKYPKQKVLQWAMAGYLLAVIALCVVAFSTGMNKALAGKAALAIYAIIFFTGICRAFSGPSFQAIVAQLVNRTHLAKAITYSTTVWQTAAVTGPVVAGLLISLLGIAYMLVVCGLLLSLAVIFCLQFPHLPTQDSNALQQNTVQRVKAGLKFVWNTRPVLTAMSLDMFAVLFGGAVAMLPVFAKDILHVGATGMGALKAAQGVGSMLMLFYLTRNPMKQGQGRLLLQSVAGFGVCIIVFALSKSFLLSFAVLLISGMLDGLSVVIRSTVLQLYVPDEMRGRVSSVNSMFINSSNELGQFESGIAARFMGTVPSVIFGGCMTLIVVAVAWVKAPTLKKLSY